MSSLHLSMHRVLGFEKKAKIYNLAFIQNEMINEFGESIKDWEIKEIAVKIQKLSEKQIDNLWHKCGWVDSEKNPENKSLPRKRILMIKGNDTLAKQHITSLLFETPKKVIYQALSEIETV